MMYVIVRISKVAALQQLKEAELEGDNLSPFNVLKKI